MIAEAQCSKRNGVITSTAGSDVTGFSQAQRSLVAGVTRRERCYVADDFEDMNLREEILQSVKAHAFTKPMPLQQRAVVPLATGYDVIIQTYSGSGKKTIVSIAVLQIINVNLKACQAIVLSSTVSAAEHMKETINDIGKCMNVQCHAFTGERSLKEDIHTLAEGVHVVTGTLERIYDLMNRNALKKCEVKLLVIEEAGEMLLCASKCAISDMIKMLSPNVQLLFLTTSVEERILKEFRSILRHPVFLATEKEVWITENTEHFYIPIRKKHSKLEILFTLYKRIPITRALIFCQTEEQANMVADNMKRKLIEIALLPDRMSQQEIDRIFQKFYTDNVNALLVTDAHNFRDVPQASVIINYDFPTTFEKYNFRTCRKDGTNHKVTVVSFITENEQHMLSSLERFCRVKMKEMELSNTDPGNFPDSVPCLQKTDDPEKKLPVGTSFIVQSFEESGLRKELIEGIREYGFKRPTPLQRNAIFPCINGYDVIIHGRPRSSITTTLAIAILQSIDYSSQCCQALVLTSTREKAQYMYEFLRELGKYMKVKCNVFYGGCPVRVDLPVLEKYAHIVVGTAGRIMDLTDRKALRTNRIKMLVLEEASDLFSEMQREQTHKIFQALNSDIQIILSSTIPKNDAVTQLKQFTKGSFCALTYRNEVSTHAMKQFYLPLKRGDLIYETISNLYIKLTIPQSVIFCNQNQNTNDSKVGLVDLSESDFLDHIRSGVKEIIKENFCSVCNHTLFSTSLLTERKKNLVSVIMNYDFLIQKENYQYSSNISYYHKAIVADIAPRKELIRIHDLESFLV